jgi:hypothetical protein
MAKNIQASALSGTPRSGPSLLAIGTNQLSCPQPASAGYWYVVVDLTDSLSVVANEFSGSAEEAPPSVARLLGNPAYFLFMVAQSIPAGDLPRGELARFLSAAGSGAQLAMIDPTVRQLGTDRFTEVSYALAATLNDQDLPGFEAASVWGPSVLNMQFMPLIVDGRTIFAPIQVGTPLSPHMVHASQHTPVAVALSTE